MDFRTTYQFKCNGRKTVFSSQETKKQSCTQSIPFVDENYADDERSCSGTAVHASGISRSLLSPFVPASASCGQHGKNTIESRQTRGEKDKEQTDSICDKNISLQKSNCFTVTSPGRTACFARLKPYLVAVGQLAVSQTLRERRLVL